MAHLDDLHWKRHLRSLHQLIDSLAHMGHNEVWQESVGGSMTRSCQLNGLTLDILISKDLTERLIALCQTLSGVEHLGGAVIDLVMATYLRSRKMGSSFARSA
jgi:hypothetical protein